MNLNKVGEFTVPADDQPVDLAFHLETLLIVGWWDVPLAKSGLPLLVLKEEKLDLKRRKG